MPIFKTMRLYLTLTLVSFVPVSGQASTTATEGCLRKTLEIIFRAHPDNLIDDLLASDMFNRFLKERKYKWGTFLTTEERGAILHDYVEYWFSKYSPSELPGIQEAILREKLKLHGVQIKWGESASNALKRISRSNVKRLGRSQYIHHPGFEEAEQAVSNLNLRFSHFTNQLDKPPQAYLLSSRQLEDAGATPGLNTAKFNKEVIKSDNHVFFYASFQREGQTFSSQYGKGALSLDYSYASDRGWISAYVMHPPDLDQWASRGLMETEGKELAEINRKADTLFAAGEHRPEVLRDSWKKQDELRKRIVGKLHLTDFTVDDFNQLIKNELLNYLGNTKYSDPSKYASALHILEQGSVSEIEKFLSDQIYGPLGLPKAFELKVPAAVPERHLTHRNLPKAIQDTP